MYNSNFALLTQALTRLLRERVFASLPQVQISTEVPDADFRQKLGNDPVLNLYLTGVRQDLSRRLSDPGRVQRGADNQNGTPDPYPRIMALSYMLTAWSRAGADHALVEQDLLYRALAGMTSFPDLPVELAQAAQLDTHGYPVQLDMLHERDGGIRSGDYWQALGTPPRPLLELTALIPIPEGCPDPLPLIQGMDYAAHPSWDPAAPAPAAYKPQISGTVTAPFPPNQLQLQFRGMETGTRSAWIRPSADGHFALSGLPEDDYMIRLTPDDLSRGKRWWGVVGVVSGGPEDLEVVYK
ncbi:Pvc16 family protein (plasmid) [Chromobacterium amazonense]|uniref:Pvc16 family protein n=1 Tax=Chromobacterium amazonense TaxID=1382803 RepID=UPI00237EB638|nr:Pvc16 family protein [Chromobacterium amazonense]MDE1715296.1 Pvc16 family protein [Chromobacterium amazonense]